MFWRLMHLLFRWNYVVLDLCDGTNLIRHAYQVGPHLFAHPYLPDTRARLLPGGQVKGQNYIDGWRPVTPETDRRDRKATHGGRR